MRAVRFGRNRARDQKKHTSVLRQTKEIKKNKGKGRLSKNNYYRHIFNVIQFSIHGGDIKLPPAKRKRKTTPDLTVYICVNMRGLFLEHGELEKADMPQWWQNVLILDSIKQLVL